MMTRLTTNRRKCFCGAMATYLKAGTLYHYCAPHAAQTVAVYRHWRQGTHHRAAA